MTDFNWDQFTVPVDGVQLTDDGYYHCEDCDERLESTGEIDRTGDYPRVPWECPVCNSRYWIDSRGPIAKVDHPQDLE